MAFQEIKTYPASSIRFDVAGVTYEWFGGLGAVITSKCRGVKVGDTRVIGGVLFYAANVHRCHMEYRIREVCWVPVGECDVNWIREYKKALFN